MSKSKFRNQKHTRKELVETMQDGYDEAYGGDPYGIEEMMDEDNAYNGFYGAAFHQHQQGQGQAQVHAVQGDEQQPDRDLVNRNRLI